MEHPDVGKHVRDIAGGLLLELATAKARIEQLEAEVKKLQEVERKVGDEG